MRIQYRQGLVPEQLGTRYRLDRDKAIVNSTPLLLAVFLLNWLVDWYDREFVQLLLRYTDCLPGFELVDYGGLWDSSFAYFLSVYINNIVAPV